MVDKLGKGRLVVIIIGIVAALAVGALVTATVIGIDSSNKDKFPSYVRKSDTSAELGTEDNPYTILEIVPDVDSALVGYLIDGQSPDSLMSIGVSDSAAALYREAFASSGDKSVSKVSDKKSTSSFTQDKSSIPDELFPAGQPAEYRVSLDNDNNGYSQYGYFYKVDKDKGDYYYDSESEAFLPAASGQDNDFKWTCLAHFRYVGGGRGNVNRVIDDIRVTTDDDSNRNYEEYKRTYSYDTASKKGAVGENAVKYEYAINGDYVFDLSENYGFQNIFAENQTQIDYVEDGESKVRTIEDAELGDAFYMTRTEDVYYTYDAYDISCKDPFIKSVVGSDANGIDYVTQVVTVTPKLLNIEDRTVGDDAAYLIANCDMIFVHNSATGYKIRKALEGVSVSDSDIPVFSADGTSGDLTRETMNRIIYRGASANPAAIVFDEEAIISANSDTKRNSTKNCEYLKRLYDVYNNLGAKLAYNWMPGYQYDKKLEAASTAEDSYYRDFQYPEYDALGRSQFVYNYVGNDDSWLTSAFADDSKIVWSALNEPAFDNEDIAKTGDELPTMSVARMMSAINKESNGYRQPDKLQILEVQPNNNSMYDAEDQSVEAKNAWVKYYLDLVPWFIGTDYDITKDITITAMPTWQFISRNEDLHETYDLIIFGNKEQDSTNGKGGYNNPYDAQGLPLLTDQMAYIGVGDLITTQDKNSPKDAQQGGKSSDFPSRSELFYSGNDITMKKFVELLDYANQAPVMIADDLYYTKDDTTDEELWQVVNPYSIDRASFMYQLAVKNLDDSFVNRYSNGVVPDLKANSVKKSLTVENCEMEFIPTKDDATGQPVAFESRDTGTYSVSMNANNQFDANRNNILRYHFLVHGSANGQYGINLYTDSNGNGIYEGSISHIKEKEANGDTTDYDSEKSLTLTIYDETTKHYVTDGILEADHTYLLTRVMPPTEVGLIPWKLELYNMANDSFRHSVIGYTRIAPGANGKTKINVLQMNTRPSMSDEKNPSVCFDSNYKNSYIGREFDKYVAGLDDFDINMEFMPNNSTWKDSEGITRQGWYQTYKSDGRDSDANKQKWAQDLMKYDMLIIGFNDSAKFTNDEVFIYGFIKFMEAGKPIILSHDLCEDETFAHSTNVNQHTQSDVRYFLRDISGQIRKYYNAAGFVASGDSSYSYTTYYMRDQRYAYIYPSNSDYFRYNGLNAYSRNSTQIKVINDYYRDKNPMDAHMIMDNSTRAMLWWSTCNYSSRIVWDWWNSHEEFTYNDNIDRDIPGIDDLKHNRNNLYWTGNTFETNRVEQVNEGKITKYPFNLERIDADTGLFKPIEVKNTHMQNYQLDLEYDSDGDVMVWYDLIGKTDNFHSGYPDVYSGRDLDSRNHYYIYTKGNITYTGVGHYEADEKSLTPDEIKLFINTMITAYRTAAAQPYITVTNAEAVTSGNNTTIYVEDKENVQKKLEEDSKATIEGTYPITYRIDDDTTNSRIRRSFQLLIYKGDVKNPIAQIYPAERATEYTIDVPLDELMRTDDMKYTIVLNSSYTDDFGVEQLTSYIHNITVSRMPLFNLR